MKWREGSRGQGGAGQAAKAKCPSVSHPERHLGHPEAFWGPSLTGGSCWVPGVLVGPEHLGRIALSLDPAPGQAVPSCMTLDKYPTFSGPYVRGHWEVGPPAL